MLLPTILNLRSRIVSIVQDFLIFWVLGLAWLLSVDYEEVVVQRTVFGDCTQREDREGISLRRFYSYARRGLFMAGLKLGASLLQQSYE